MRTVVDNSENHLVLQLPPDVRRRLRAHATDWAMAAGVEVVRRGADLRHVWLPRTGFIAQRIDVDGQRNFETNLIGHEGMLGITLVLGIRAAPLSAIIRGAGTALRIPAPKFCALLRRNPSLRRVCHRYLFAQHAEFSRTLACNRFHDVESRLARWLLMAVDRAGDDALTLTHAVLAAMLGVRRSAVTVAAGRLQQHGLIRYSRGRIRVTSRAGLEAVSCECYRSVRANDDWNGSV